MNRKKLALCLLLLLFAGSVVYSVMGAPKEKRVTALKNRPGAAAPVARKPAPKPGTTIAPTITAPISAPKQAPTAAPAPAPAPTVATAPTAVPNVANSDPGRLRLDLLDQEGQRFSGFRRNIFSPIFREEVKLPPFKPLPPPPRPVAKLPPPPPPPPMPMPMPVMPQPPTPDQIADSELSKFTFLGFLKKNAERTVFLSSNNEIFLAKKGSKLGNKFLVTDVTDEAITIKALAGGREIVIPLVENRTLSRRSSIRTP
jgi:hypothetical protein